MKINVAYQDTLPESVTVYVDGLCVHNEVTEDLVEDEFGNSSWEMFCANCDAWYNDLDDKWIGGIRDRYSAPF